jgi:hypothetical protein
MHSTDNLKDGYIGSGKRLWYSIKKNGKENFKFEILEMLPDRSSLKERERHIVNEQILKDDNCLNLRIGGEGGGSFTIEQQKINAQKSKIKQSFLRENDFEWVNKKSKKISQSNLEQYQNGQRERKYFFDWTGKKMLEETKIKIGKSNSIKQRGQNNSQFGTCWITNGEECKKIKKGESPPFGWWFGRKLFCKVKEWSSLSLS